MNFSRALISRGNFTSSANFLKDLDIKTAFIAALDG
jgi:hypothetical protein